MSSMDQKIAVADLMLALEKAMREAQLWDADTPPAEALLSQQPFACDVLTLQQWLQWVFLPRMKAIVESDAELPHSCHITAYAEETVAKLDNNTDEVMRLLKELDQLLSV